MFPSELSPYLVSGCPFLLPQRRKDIAPLNYVFDDGEHDRKMVLRLKPTSNGFSRVECNKLQITKYPLSLAPQDNVGSGHPFAQRANTTFKEKDGFVSQTISVQDTRDQDFTFLIGVCEPHVRISVFCKPASFCLKNRFSPRCPRRCFRPPGLWPFNDY